MNRCLPLLFLLGALGMNMPASPNSKLHSPSTIRKPFGKTADGQKVEEYILTNRNGTEVGISAYGATVVSLKVPDRSGKFADVVLGYPELNGYESDKVYFGVIVGRYANRIAKGHFMLDGQTYTLARNNGENTLHGGVKGFNKAVWAAKQISSVDGQSMEFSHLSKDGDENFPGNLQVTVVYTLTDADELRIEYSATTDKNTVLNLTNHSYFNLAGQGMGNVLAHVLQIEADKFTPVDQGLIPTGELRDVQGTPFDFRKPIAIGARINQDEEQLKLGGGYDHNFVLRRPETGEVSLAARVTEPTSGRVLEVWTTEPGIQLYTGNFLDGTIKGKSDAGYQKRSAFCLETQHFPDSPNHPTFPSVVLNPGATFHSITSYKFSIVQ
jgi:aldose 1-epimerase